MEVCRKVSAIVGALLALGISIPFTVVYANQYHELYKNRYSTNVSPLSPSETLLTRLIPQSDLRWFCALVTSTTSLRRFASSFRSSQRSIRLQESLTASFKAAVSPFQAPFRSSSSESTVLAGTALPAPSLATLSRNKEFS